MTIIHIEHPVRDFETWKTAFDSDPVGREASGVRRYRVYRATETPDDVAIDLVFDDRATAEAFHARLKTVWTTPQATGALGGAPQSRLVDVVEDRAY